MKLNYRVKGQVSINMVDYVELMVKGFPEEEKLGAQVKSPWNENLFKVNQSSPSLSKEMAEQFHMTM
jgi:hypothetical protein